MLRMWYLDRMIQALLPEVQRSLALPFPSVTCVPPNTIKVRDWGKV